MLYGVIILVAASGLFWLAYRRPRPRRWLLPRRLTPRTSVAAVDRQHRHLQAGGMLGESACAKTKAHFRELLNSGRTDLIERELRAGLDFALQVRALAELGTPDTGVVLERLLSRTLAGDPIEQAWYWVDIASALRRLNRTEALPAVLRCAEAADGLPPGAVLAAEAVAFSNFPGVLKQPASAAGRAALKALTATARAARDGLLDIASVIRAGLGDKLADVSTHADHGGDPWLIATLIEAERVFRRIGHWARLLPTDTRALAERQAMRLWATGERRATCLTGTTDKLLAKFSNANTEEQGAILRCLCELRADATSLFPHLPDRRSPWWGDAIRVLLWSKSPVVGPVLASQVNRFTRKARNYGRAVIVLGVLRAHACYEAERALLRAATSANPEIKCAAVGSLGWWSPYDPDRVVRLLREAHTDSDAEVRRSAGAALARLGARAALAEVAAGLNSEEPTIRVETAAQIATEELTWLWPDLETAAASSDLDSALAAREALERLRERLFGFAE